jgi:hypothetical protein
MSLANFGGFWEKQEVREALMERKYPKSEMLCRTKLILSLLNTLKYGHFRNMLLPARLFVTIPADLLSQASLMSCWSNLSEFCCKSLSE